MKTPSIKYTSLFISTLLLFNACNQNSTNHKEDWIAFTEENSDLYGFANSDGDVMIEPQFSGPFSAKIFKNIIGVQVQKNDSIHQYYLLKSGQQLGHDSMYISDSKFDCEHEGYIRFTDPKTHFTGLFDSLGRVAIAPQFNTLSQVHKGYLLAKTQAQLVYPSHDPNTTPLWIGGHYKLINIKGETVVEFMYYDAEHLNLHSLEISTDAPDDNPERTTYQGYDGRYYSFINNKKSFDQFFLSLKKDISAHLSKDLVIWSSDNNWLDIDRSDFISANNIRLQEMETFFQDSLNIVYINVQNFIPLTDKNQKKYEVYRDNCDNWNIMEFPIYEVSYPYSEESYRSLYILKTRSGFEVVGAKLEE